MDDDTPTISVPIRSELYNELVLRMGDPHKDVIGLIEHAVETYLERTAGDGWSEAYEQWREQTAPAEDFRARFGDPQQGYHWTPVFLPNGTRLSMLYGGQTHEAEIRQQRICMGEREFSSPSVFASTVANGTSRNAWRDLRIKRPADHEFRPADELRREGARK
jgi:hypothetical protein